MVDTQKVKKSVNPAVAAAAGVIVGAAGAAMAAALTHEPTRKKMVRTLQDAKMKVERKVKDLQKSSKPIVKKAQDKMREMTDVMQPDEKQEKETIM